MKNILYGFIFISLIYSCRKEYPFPSKDYPNEIPTSGVYDTSKYVSRWGEFLVIDGVMFMDNKETGEHFTFNHFGGGKIKSSLRWGGTLFDIEEIIKDSTTYSFWDTPSGGNGYGKFVLNNDFTKYYMVNYMGEYTSIIEDPRHGQHNLGGSARPFVGGTYDKKNNLIKIRIQEMEEVINGYECHYWTVLTLKKIKSW